MEKIDRWGFRFFDILCPGESDKGTPQQVTFDQGDDFRRARSINKM
jgi:hypothetical protein